MLHVRPLVVLIVKTMPSLLCILCKSLGGMVSFCANDRTICLRMGHCNLLSVGLSVGHLELPGSKYRVTDCVTRNDAPR